MSTQIYFATFVINIGGLLTEEEKDRMNEIHKMDIEDHMKKLQAEFYLLKRDHVIHEFQ